MKLRTEIETLDHKGRINHGTSIFLIGSCFTDTIGARLQDALFRINSNPFGTVYNPASIRLQFERILSMEEFSDKDLVSNNGMFHSFFAHSSLSSVSRHQTLTSLNNAQRDSHLFLKSADVAVITLGSAMVYSRNDSGDIVANCHKFPSGYFRRYMLTLDDVRSNLESVRNILKSFNRDIFLIFTVSPIRYISDGLHGNQVSKSLLLLGVDDICHSHPDDCLYFPSYEILMDDLRDYRFYDTDMKHPSGIAADYVFDIFSKSFFSNKTIELSGQCTKLTRRLCHRPLTDNSEAFHKFRTDTNELVRQFADKHPEIAETIYKRFQL